MDKKQLVIIAGAVAAIVGLYFLLTRRDTVVQLPQVAGVGTAPGQDTTPQELGFKANVFSTYADFLKSQNAAEQRTRQLMTQSDVELARIEASKDVNASNLELQRIREAGQTERAQIFANADVVTSGQRSQSDLARLAQQSEMANRAYAQQRNQSILQGILGALGALTGNQQRQQGSGSGSGGYGTPPFNPNANARAYGRVPIPRGVNPILFDPGFTPAFPAFDPGAFGFSTNDFLAYDEWYNPFASGNDYGYGGDFAFSDYPDFSFEGDTGYSDEPVFTFDE